MDLVFCVPLNVCACYSFERWFVLSTRIKLFVCLLARFFVLVLAVVVSKYGISSAPLSEMNERCQNWRHWNPSFKPIARIFQHGARKLKGIHLRKREVNNSDGWHYPIKRYSVTVKTRSNGFVKPNSWEDNQQNTVAPFFFFQIFKQKDEKKSFYFKFFLFAWFIHESDCFDEWINTTTKKKRQTKSYFE